MSIWGSDVYADEPGTARGPATEDSKRNEQLEERRAQGHNGGLKINNSLSSFATDARRSHERSLSVAPLTRAGLERLAMASHG